MEGECKVVGYQNYYIVDYSVLVYITMPKARSQAILCVTPSFNGGSWLFTKEILLHCSKSFDLIAAGLGQISKGSAEFRTFSIPFPRYDKYGYITTMKWIFAICYELPLAFLGWWLSLIYRPRVIVANGLVACFMSIPVAKIVGAKLVLSYHGSIDSYVEGSTRRFLRLWGHKIDHVFVNSMNAKKEIAAIADSVKISCVAHWADNLFFQDIDRTAMRDKLGFSNKLVILYVGRLDRDKQVSGLINVVDYLKNTVPILFVFAGVGEYSDEIERRARMWDNVKNLGYIDDRSRLRDLYASADVVWSYADSTYLAKPAVEALASGTPIIIPNISAVPPKGYRDKELRPRNLPPKQIPYSLVPSETGWIVDASIPREVVKLILGLMHENLETMRSNCKSYARANYGPSNISVAVQVLTEMSHATSR